MAVFLFVMAAITSGIEILKQGKVSPFQDILK